MKNIKGIGLLFTIYGILHLVFFLHYMLVKNASMMTLMSLMLGFVVVYVGFMFIYLSCKHK